VNPKAKKILSAVGLCILLLIALPVLYEMRVVVYGIIQLHPVLLLSIVFPVVIGIICIHVLRKKVLLLRLIIPPLICSVVSFPLSLIALHSFSGSFDGSYGYTGRLAFLGLAPKISFKILVYVIAIIELIKNLKNDKL